MRTPAICNSVRLDYGGYLPCPVQDRGRSFLWPVHPQHGDELAFRGRQPIGFFIRARRLVLKIKRQRSVGIVLRLIAHTDGELVQRVGNEPPALVYSRTS